MDLARHDLQCEPGGRPCAQGRVVQEGLIAALCVAYIGRYPNRKELEELTPTLRMHVQKPLKEGCEFYKDLAERSTEFSTPVAKELRLIDFSQQTRTISQTGVPRVLRSLVLNGRNRGWDTVRWDDGRLLLDPRELFDSWSAKKGFDLRSIGNLSLPVLVRSAGWQVARPLLRVPYIRAIIGSCAEAFERLFRSSSAGSGLPLWILHRATLVISEVPSSDVSERLLAWTRVMPRLRIVTFVHDTLPVSHPEFTHDHVRKCFEAFLPVIRTSAMVITSSRSVALELEAIGALNTGNPAQEVHTLGFGSNADEWTPAEFTGCSLPTFLMVGGLLERKNVGLALRAAGLLADRGHRVCLRVVGQSPMIDRKTRKLIRQVRRKGAEVQIDLRVTDSELAARIDDSVATLYLSFAEGYGLPVVESLVRKVPVIASDIPTNREFVPFGGVVLVPVDDPQRLAAEMLRFLESDSYRDDLAASINRDAIPRGLDAWAAQVLDLVTESAP